MPSTRIPSSEYTPESSASRPLLVNDSKNEHSDTFAADAAPAPAAFALDGAPAPAAFALDGAPAPAPAAAPASARRNDAVIEWHSASTDAPERMGPSGPYAGVGT